MDVGPAELGLILLAVMLLFGYKKLPDAARSMGRSLRIFKSEMSTMSTEGSAPAVPAPAVPAPAVPAPAPAPTVEQPREDPPRD